MQHLPDFVAASFSLKFHGAAQNSFEVSLGHAPLVGLTARAV